MFDLNGMMGKMQEMQARMKESQEKLVHIRATGESGAGMVKATVNGHKKVVRIEVDPILVKPEDATVLQDLIVAAVNKALDEVEEKIKVELASSTQGMLPNIPGLDWSKFMR